jgi:hypothetical protein
VHKAFPDRADKVLNMINPATAVSLNDSKFGRRMSGEGKLAESIHQMYQDGLRTFLAGREMPPYDLTLFTPKGGKQTSMF